MDRSVVGGADGLLGLWVPVVAYMALLFFLSSRSSVPVPAAISDKLVHAAAYAVLAVLFTRAFLGGLPARVGVRTALLAIGATIAYGATDEWHQSFVFGRVSDGADLVADGVGAMVGAVACWAWGTIWTRGDV